MTFFSTLPLLCFVLENVKRAQFGDMTQVHIIIDWHTSDIQMPPPNHLITLDNHLEMAPDRLTTEGVADEFPEKVLEFLVLHEL